MTKNPLFTAIATVAIAFSATSIQAKESYSQNLSNTIFVCATDIETPTMFSYTPGKTKLTPLISWHEEYLLSNQSGAEVCQETASKLQEIYQQQEKKSFRTEQKEDSTLVCMVGGESETCSDKDSETLFSVNPNYDASCVLDNRQPLECVAIGNIRGVRTIPDAPYTVQWWPFSW